jgi:uncharacterized protein (TIGR02452 family)
MKFDVISAAAYDYNHNSFKEEHVNNTCLTIQNIFITAIEHGVKNLILGTLGCGAFKNNPVIIYSLFDYWIKIYGHHFEEIFFAVLIAQRRENQDVINYAIFKNLETSSILEQCNKTNNTYSCLIGGINYKYKYLKYKYKYKKLL